jgi:phage shock protein E
MRHALLFLLPAALIASPLAAQVSGSPLIDYTAYIKLTKQVAPYRKKRLISLDDFQARAAKPGVLLLDARSAQAFAEGHIKGAINLPLPDFNEASLAELIGNNRDREILIYCNNNFTNNVRPVQTKMLPLALNIQSFINLYGYGYRNLYELGEAVDMNSPDVDWVRAGVQSDKYPMVPQSLRLKISKPT